MTIRQHRAAFGELKDHQEMRGLTFVALVMLVCSAVLAGQVATPRKSILIFVDDLHLQFNETPRLRQALRDIANRLPALDRVVGLVSDGPSNKRVIIPADDNAALVEVARTIQGSGLRPDQLATPTPAIAAEIARREATAQEVLERTMASMKPDAVIYITDREVAPSGVTVPIVVTAPAGVNAAIDSPLLR